MIAPAAQALTPSRDGPIVSQVSSRLKGRIRLLLFGKPCGPPARLFPIIHDRKKRPEKASP